MYVVPEPLPKPVPSGRTAAPAWPFRLDHSWLLSTFGLRPATLRPLGGLLVAATAAGYSVAALATIPLLVPAGAWAGLVLGSTLASALLLGLFANRGLLVGLAIDIVLLVVVLATLWLPGV